MTYYSRKSYSNSTIFSGYIVDTSPSKFTMWSIIQNYRNVREFVGRKLKKRCIFSLQGKFIFFKVLNNNNIANLSISSIKKVMFRSYRRQNDDVFSELLTPWPKHKKSMWKGGFEPTRTVSIGLAVQRLNHSATPP